MQAKRDKIKTALICVLTLAYLFGILYVTILTRYPGVVREARLTPFWSYWYALKGDLSMMKEIVMNVCLFVPFGWFAAELLSARAGGKTLLRRAVLVCFACSLLVELAQYLTGRGLFDIDDVLSNSLGGLLGAYLYCCLKRRGKLSRWRPALTALFVLAGVAACWIVSSRDSLPKQVRQFDFAVTQTESGGALRFSGRCRVYQGKTPPYRLLLVGEDSARQIWAETEIEGENFTAAADADASEKYELLIRFRGHELLPTGTWLRGTAVEYVPGAPPKPELRDETLSAMLAGATLKAYDPGCRAYVYEDGDRFLWLVGTELTEKTHFLCQLHTSEPEKLPENRRVYGFDNLGFSPGGGNELTARFNCPGWRVFEREIPREYPITEVVVGFSVNGKFIWSQYFRVDVQK